MLVSIPELASEYGELVTCQSNNPIKIDDPNCFWFVEQGAVNLFLIETQDEIDQASPRHLLHRAEGTMFPGVLPDVEENGSVLSVLVRGLPNTRIRRIPIAALAQVEPTALASQVNLWLIDITQALARFASYLPRPTLVAQADETGTFEPGILSILKHVGWISLPPQDSSMYMDIVDGSKFVEPTEDEVFLPLTSSTWLTIRNTVTLRCLSTESLIEADKLLATLTFFHRVALSIERINRQLAIVDQANLDQARTASTRSAEQQARQQLFNLYDKSDSSAQDTGKDALVRALEHIGGYQGIHFAFSAPVRGGEGPADLEEILENSGVRTRQVRLDRNPNWWKTDSNALLAFNAETGNPVALLPGALGRYRVIDPVDGKSSYLTKTRATQLANEAWTFYQPLPTAAIKPTGILKFAFQGTALDVLRIVGAGIPAGVLKLVPALMLGFVAHHLLTGGSTSVLVSVVAVLLFCGILGLALHLLLNASMMRLEGRATSRLEAAFWERLIRLPIEVLNQYPASDLAMSSLIFQKVRDGVQELVTDTVLAVLFFVPVFVLIFLYNTTLGYVTLFFSLLTVGITILLGFLQISPYGQMNGAARRVTNHLYQVIGGIGKLRMENAEGSAFNVWAQEYRTQKLAELEVGKWESHTRAFGVALPFLAAALLLLGFISLEEQELSLVHFVVVFTVFISFQLVIARVGESFEKIVSIVPATEDMEPMLTTVPEQELEGERVDYLSGAFMFDRVSFRYEPDGPLILDDVTFRVQPGEFIAIAGESGAGKSTLFRLALGLDTPTAGAVYYDGRDVRNLNVLQLRRKIGVVPQAVGLHPQDLWDNLVSHHWKVETEDVWQATRVADIEEQIKRMPMGLMTMVGNSASVLSGGESQRITIARSIIGNPRIMFLDEATNWLDNESQATVMQNLNSLTSTRVVIAHRLSTLEHADRIYVMQAGKIVQTGSYKELLEQEGVFSELVKRMIA